MQLNAIPASPKEQQAHNNAFKNETAQQFEALQQEAKCPRSLPKMSGVVPFDYDYLPPVARNFVRDIAERMQCPPDYLCVSIYAMLATVIGRKVGIRPMRYDDWLVIANLWAACVGNSGTSKSPAIDKALKPLKKLVEDALNQFAKDNEQFEIEESIHKLKLAASKSIAQRKLNDDPTTDLTELLKLEPLSGATVLKRYIANNSSYEALGDLLIENPNGLLVESDELIGLLKQLDSKGQEPARAFYLTAADGDKGYTFDRIGRGKALHVPALCVSIIGGIQPGRLSPYVREAVNGGTGADGLLQRFGLLVYPDISKEWKEVDRPPDVSAKEAIDQLVNKLDKLNPADIGAKSDENGKVPFLRFDDQAQALFSEWRGKLETRLRSGDEHEAFVSHLSKYRKLIPSLALINHLCDKGCGSVDEKSLLRAIAYAEYLESHARRVYNSAIEPGINAARTLLERLSTAKIDKKFTAREIRRKGWTGLDTPVKAQAALDVLVDYGYLFEIDSETGGRPTRLYILNETEK